MEDNLSTINNGRIFDGILFATHRDRALYIRTLVRDRPQWLKDNPDSWRSIEDVQREAAQPAAPVESDVNVVAASSAPNGQMSSHDARKDGDDEDGVALVDALSGDCSPPCEPNGSMKAELRPPAKAAMSETEGPKTETTALGAMGRKQGRGGGRKKQKRPAETSKARQKRHERMRVVLERLSECPTQRHAARKAGIHPKTLAYWLKCSEAGDDGYDIEWQGWMSRFHEHVESAMDEPVGEVEVKAFELAEGVLYNENDPHTYLRRPNAKMMRFLLEWKRPEKWGKHPKIDVPQKGGVVLIVPTAGLPRPDETGAPPPEPARERRRKKVRTWKSLSRMLRKAKD
jgi:hypothetical protein